MHVNVLKAKKKKIHTGGREGILLGKSAPEVKAVNWTVSTFHPLSSAASVLQAS